MNIFFVVFAIMVAVFVLVSCSGSAAPTAGPEPSPGQNPASTQPASQSPAQPERPQTTSTAAASPAAASAPSASPPAAELQSRVDVIYSHMNQRCPTCLCFEERINAVIKQYFGDAIASGKLTYKVLNAQDPLNGAFVKKFKAVGSQLFINTVVNGYDNIEDIQAIWDWNCRTDQSGFDQKIREAIEARLKNIP